MTSDDGIAYHRFAATRGETATVDLSERWTADLVPMVSEADVFVCPADESPTIQKSGIAISYGMNSQVRSKSVLAASQVLMADYGNPVIDFDEVDSEHESEYVDLRHNGGVNVLYGDGSVRGRSGGEFF